ncbi:hypothetical protein D3C75_1022680 [compost metagenome]
MKDFPKDSVVIIYEDSTLWNYMHEYPETRDKIELALLDLTKKHGCFFEHESSCIMYTVF